VFKSQHLFHVGGGGLLYFVQANVTQMRVVKLDDLYAKAPYIVSNEYISYNLDSY